MISLPQRARREVWGWHGHLNIPAPGHYLHCRLQIRRLIPVSHETIGHEGILMVIQGRLLLSVAIPIHPDEDHVISPVDVAAVSQERVIVDV